MAAAWISVRHGFLSEEILEDMADLFSYFGLPTKVSNLSPDHILETTTHDKKMDSGVIRFILLKQIGEAYIDRSVTADEMKEAIFYLAD